MTSLEKPAPGELTKAVENGQIELVRQYLDRGADVDERNQYGNTPLFKAAHKGYVDIVRLLLERGAGVNLRNEHVGATPLMWAAGRGQLRVVEILLAAGAEIDVVSKTGHTASTYAGNHQHADVIALLDKTRAGRAQAKEEARNQRLAFLRARAPGLRFKRGGPS